MPPANLIVGLTGGIGSGKSEVSRRFTALGIEVIDADEIAREVVIPGKPALTEITEHFGKHLLTPNGDLDRPRLREIIFKDPDEKRWLESLLHPQINALIRERLQAASSPYAILASPLLLETKQDQLVDRVLVVDASEEQQIARASRRDTNRVEQIKAIMATQSNREARLARADDVIDNDGELSALDAQLIELHQRYLHLAQQKAFPA